MENNTEINTRLDSPKSEAYDLYKDLVSLIRNAQFSFIRIGQVLSRLKRDNYFKEILPDVSWKEFLAAPEINCSVSFASRAMGCWTRFIEYYGFSEDELCLSQIKIQKLLTATKELPPKEIVEELLAKARTLSTQDFYEELSDHTHNFTDIHALKCDCGYIKTNE